jgi:hypothetical protein
MRMSAPKEVICYSYHVSHVLNLGEIPALLAADGWRVRCLQAFGPEAYPLDQVPGIEYHFDVDLPTVGTLEADLYLTPMVGQSAHFPSRAKRVHFLVSLTSLEGVYDAGHFDHFDVIACAGTHHTTEFAQLGAARGWAGKTLLPVGYPKLDGQRRSLAESDLAPAGDGPTVVFAPTHSYYINEAYSVLGRHGEDLVAGLIEDGMRVVFRPHVESWRDQDRPVVDRIVDRFGSHPFFELDRSGNYFESYARSDLMLTDISGTGFTFAFTFGRPAIYFAPNPETEVGKSGIQFDRRDDIGFVARRLDKVVPLARRAYDEGDALRGRIAGFRDELIFNPGRSEEYFVEQAADLVRPVRGPAVTRKPARPARGNRPHGSRRSRAGSSRK